MAAMNTVAILTPGPFDDVCDRGVAEDQRYYAEGDGEPALACAACSQGDGDGCGGDDDQHPGGICAALGIYIGTEDDRDDERGKGEGQHQGPNGAGPLWGHPVARQVARDQIQ
jgi:hypothetical protein